MSTTTSEPLVNQRNIYKDTSGASNKYGDFQLRPNFLVTMVVAPQLFDKNNALQALGMVKEKLVSVLGIKTLDESDLNYDGNYWNQDSNDFKTAGGFNYHQGPVSIVLFLHFPMLYRVRKPWLTISFFVGMALAAEFLFESSTNVFGGERKIRD